MPNGANSLARAKWNCAYHTKSPLKQSHCLPAVLSSSKKSLTSWRTGERVPPLLHLPVLLKSFGFSGAKTARKRFFALGNEIFRRFQSSRVRRTRRRARLKARDLRPSRALRRFFRQSHCLPAVLSSSKKSLTSRRTGERVPPLLHLPVLLKSFGFSGVKTARKRFFALENEIFRRFQSSRVRRTRRRARLKAQESFGHIELSKVFSTA